MMVWKTSDGRMIPHQDLTNEHLCNILNWIESSPGYSVPNFDQRTDEYFWLRKEAMKRGIRWRKFADNKLQDGDLEYRDGMWWVKSRERTEKSNGPFDHLIGQKVMVKVRQDDFGSRSLRVEGMLESISVMPMEPGEGKSKTTMARDLKAGDSFQRARFFRIPVHGRLDRYVVCDPVGETYRALDRLLAEPRVLVTNTRTGKTFFIAAWEQVIKVEQ